MKRFTVGLVASVLIFGSALGYSAADEDKPFSGIFDKKPGVEQVEKKQEKEGFFSRFMSRLFGDDTEKTKQKLPANWEFSRRACAERLIELQKHLALAFDYRYDNSDSYAVRYNIILDASSPAGYTGFGIDLQDFRYDLMRHRIQIEIICPETGKPYVVGSDEEAKNYYVGCPNPELHNLKTMYIIYDKETIQMYEDEIPEKLNKFTMLIKEQKEDNE